MTLPLSELQQSETWRHSPPQLQECQDRGYCCVWGSGLIALFRKVKQVIDSDTQGLCNLITFSKDAKGLETQMCPHEVQSSVCKPPSQHPCNRWCLQGSEQYPVPPAPWSSICNYIINHHAAMFTTTWQKPTIHFWRLLMVAQVTEPLNIDVKPGAPCCVII